MAIADEPVAIIFTAAFLLRFVVVLRK